MFFRRLAVFFRLKAQEIGQLFGLNAKTILSCLIVYMSLFAVVGLSYSAERYLGWTWQYWALDNLPSSDTNNDNKPTSLFSEGDEETPVFVQDVSLPLKWFVILVGVPLLGAIIIASWLLFPGLIFIIFLVLCFVGLLGWKFIEWLWDNWEEAGRIVNKENEE